MTLPTQTDELSLPAELVAFAEGAIGPFRLVLDLSWPYEGSEVYRLRDAHDVDHILKRLSNARFYASEVDGYRWAGALGAGCAPRLEAAEPGLRAVIVTCLPGVLLKHAGLDVDGETEAYHQAGVLLRRLHNGAEAVRDTRVIDRLVANTGLHVEKAAGELGIGQRVLIGCARDRLASLTTRLNAVPTHGDFWPRNLLFDSSTGRVAVIDFERAALAPPVRDMVRLETGVFTRNPAARAGFYRGYGRELDGIEQEALLAWAVLDAVSALAWAQTNSDDHLIEHARSVLRSTEAAWAGTGPADRSWPGFPRLSREKGEGVRIESAAAE